MQSASRRIFVVFIRECRLTSEIHKNVSTENVSMYTVHEIGQLRKPERRNAERNAERK